MAGGDQETGLSESLVAPVEKTTGQAPVEKSTGGKQYILVIAIVCMMGGAILFHEAVENCIQQALNFMAGLGNWAAFFIFLLTAALNLFMLPTFPLMIGAGVVCTNIYGSSDVGGLVGTLAVFSGLWLGSMVAFMLGRLVFKEYAKKELHNHQVLQVLNGMIAESGWTIVLLARMSPVLPAEVFNYACSLVETLTPLQYGLGCLGSLVPVSFWVFSSAQAAEMAHSAGNGTAAGAPQGGYTLIALNLVIIFALSAAFYYAYDKYKKKLESSADVAFKDPRRFVAQRAATLGSLGTSADSLGIHYHSEPSLSSIAEDFVKWDEEVTGVPVERCHETCGWLKVESGGQLKGYLPMMCPQKPMDGMCAMAMCTKSGMYKSCRVRHGFVRALTKDGIKSVKHSSSMMFPLHPGLMA